MTTVPIEPHAEIELRGNCLKMASAYGGTTEEILERAKKYFEFCSNLLGRLPVEHG